MQDKKKIEADEPVFGLASVDLVEVEAPTWHIAQHLPAIRCTYTASTRHVSASHSTSFQDF